MTLPLLEQLLVVSLCSVNLAAGIAHIFVAQYLLVAFLFDPCHMDLHILRKAIVSVNWIAESRINDIRHLIQSNPTATETSRTLTTVDSSSSGGVAHKSTS